MADIELDFSGIEDETQREALEYFFNNVISLDDYEEFAVDGKLEVNALLLSNSELASRFVEWSKTDQAQAVSSNLLGEFDQQGPDADDILAQGPEAFDDMMDNGEVADDVELPESTMLDEDIDKPEPKPLNPADLAAPADQEQALDPRKESVESSKTPAELLVESQQAAKAEAELLEAEQAQANAQRIFDSVQGEQQSPMNQMSAVSGEASTQESQIAAGSNKLVNGLDALAGGSLGLGGAALTALGTGLGAGGRAIKDKLKNIKFGGDASTFSGDDLIAEVEALNALSTNQNTSNIVQFAEAAKKRAAAQPVESIEALTASIKDTQLEGKLMQMQAYMSDVDTSLELNDNQVAQWVEHMSSKDAGVVAMATKLINDADVNFEEELIYFQDAQNSLAKSIDQVYEAATEAGWSQEQINERIGPHIDQWHSEKTEPVERLTSLMKAASEAAEQEDPERARRMKEMLESVSKRIEELMAKLRELFGGGKNKDNERKPISMGR